MRADRIRKCAQSNFEILNIELTGNMRSPSMPLVPKNGWNLCMCAQAKLEFKIILGFIYLMCFATSTPEVV